jgi:transcriptional regulator with XRE-family HTH domain
MLGDMEKPTPPPEAHLLRQAIKRSGMSQRRVAALAEMSEGRLRQIINGYASVGAGQFVAVSAPDLTLARIADVLNLTQDDLSAAGRGGAAVELYEIQGQRYAGQWPDDGVEAEIRAARPGAQLSDRELIEELDRRLAERAARLNTAQQEKGGSDDAGDAEAEKTLGPGAEWPRAAREGDVPKADD